MKALKLTILLENGLSKAALANVFGDYYTLGKKLRFIEFTFPSINMLSAKHLRPIHDLLKNTFEVEKPLEFKMFWLHDQKDDTRSPVAINCLRGSWYTTAVSNGAEMNTSDSLYGLF